jgi:hypothetical protein
MQSGRPVPAQSKEQVIVNWEFWTALVLGLAALIGITFLLAVVLK